MPAFEFDATSIPPYVEHAPRYLLRKDLSEMRSANWKGLLAGLGVSTMADAAAAGQLSRSVFVTNCCGTKGVDLPVGTPDVFYLGAKQQRFISRCREFGLSWAILSDLYGIHMDGEALPFYDLAPNGLSQDQLWQRGADMREKLLDWYGGLPHLVYIKAPPSTAVPYLCMLLASGCTFSFSTAL